MDHLLKKTQLLRAMAFIINKYQIVLIKSINIFMVTFFRIFCPGSPLIDGPINTFLLVLLSIILNIHTVEIGIRSQSWHRPNLVYKTRNNSGKKEISVLLNPKNLCLYENLVFFIGKKTDPYNLTSAVRHVCETHAKSPLNFSKLSSVPLPLLTLQDQ